MRRVPDPGRRRVLKTLGAAALIPLAARASAARADIGAAARGPGVHTIMRHALAPGYSDPAAFRIGACETQRNLNDEGRAQAAATGAALAAAGLVFSRVATSQWCRCRDTARLLDLGPVEDLPPLNSFFEDRGAGPAQTAATLAWLRGLGPEEKAMLVTHQVNISALAGRGTTSGEVLFFRLGADAGSGPAVEIVDQFLIQP